MNRDTVSLVCAGLLGFVAAKSLGDAAPAPAPDAPCPGPVCPVPAPEPKKPEPVRPKPAPSPWGDSGAPVGAKVGNSVAPDGKTEINCDLPGDLHRKNTASKGLGLCVFTSIHHAAMWQDVKALQEFPRWVTEKGIPGGSYPEKTAKLIKQICADKGVPEPEYIQVEGGDLEILKRACKSGRMPGVTYSHSPTGRYGGQKISHMVSLPHADDQFFAVLDNNYPGADAYEWMTPDEFRRTYAPGWAVILLSPGAPLPPHN